MPTPQDYLNLVAAVKNMPANAQFKVQLAEMQRDFPELMDTDPNDASIFHRHNTRMTPWPSSVIRPTDEDSLVALLEANKNKFTAFRAMGDGFGFANAAATNGCLVHMRDMNAGLPLEAENFRGDLDIDEDDYQRVRAGITFGALNTLLGQTGHTVYQQPGYANLTLSGCSSAGGHGSGINLFGISGYIEAIELTHFDANKNVRVTRVERSNRPDDGTPNALTDPTKYAATHSSAKYSLVQDDELFHAARCAQGHLGIISAVTLKRRKSFVLQEDRWLSTWAEAKVEVPKLFAQPETHSVHVWINPYLTNAASPNVLITRLSFTNEPIGGARGFGIIFGGPSVITDIAGAFLGNNPGPGIDAALKTCQSLGARLQSVTALDFGPPNDLAVSASSLGFEANRADEVMVKLVPAMAGWLAQGNRITSPIGMRWVKGSQDWLSPQFGHDTIMLEVPILVPLVGGKTEKSKETLDLYANFMMDNFEGRPHWGQQNPMSAAQFKKNYAPGIPSFVKAMKRFNPNGMFDGALTAQLGLRELVNAA